MHKRHPTSCINSQSIVPSQHTEEGYYRKRISFINSDARRKFLPTRFFESFLILNVGSFLFISIRNKHCKALRPRRLRQPPDTQGRMYLFSEVLCDTNSCAEKRDYRTINKTCEFYFKCQYTKQMVTCMNNLKKV